MPPSLLNFPSLDEAKQRHLVIVGLGFSGVALARQLLNLLPDGHRLTLINASGATARGLAYGTRSPDHLLNVPAQRMSALADHDGDFVQWLHAHGLPHRPHEFVPRSLYGDYLLSGLKQAIAARPGIAVQVFDQHVCQRITRRGA